VDASGMTTLPEIRAMRDEREEMLWCSFNRKLDIHLQTRTIRCAQDQPPYLPLQIARL
jgi:hypothetical protein